VALIGGEAFVRESQARYARHAQIALERLRAIDGVEVPRPTGAFYVFPKLDDLTDSYALCESLVIKHKLGLAPGAAFGAGGEGHIRLCFAVDEATLNEAIDRFERAWKGGLGRG
jgi:aspartate/methionine/tyrosine aminotransferase